MQATTSRQRTPQRWLPAVTLGATALYWYLVLALLVVSRLIPLVMGWPVVVVTSGSMEPLIRAGDVVAYEPTNGEGLAAGTVIIFENPAVDGALVTHRIVSVNPDGTYVTRGAAAAVADSTPLHPAQVRGTGKLVVPFAGLPQLWLREGAWGSFALFVASLAAAKTYLVAARRRRPDDEPSIRVDLSEHELETRVASRSGSGSIIGAMLVLGMVSGVSIPGSAAAFSDATSSASNDFSAAPSFTTISFVQTVGITDCGNTTSTIVVPAGGVAAGNTLLVRVVLRDASATAPVAAADGSGNTYVVDADVARTTRVRAVVLRTHVDTALGAGDTIVVTHPDGRAESVVVEEFSGIAPTSPVDAVATAQGRSTTPAVTVSTMTADVLVYGVLGTRGTAAHTEPAGWTPLVLEQLRCARPLDNAAAYRLEAAPGTFTYDPTLSGRRHWAGAVVAYAAG